MEDKYAIDKIVGDIIVAENLETRQLEYIFKSTINEEINEGDILVYKDNKFCKDEDEYNKRLEMMKEKFNRIRRK